MRTKKQLKYPFGTKDPISRAKLKHKSQIRLTLHCYNTTIQKLVTKTNKISQKHRDFLFYLEFWHNL